jgi:hypothetical protein
MPSPWASFHGSNVFRLNHRPSPLSVTARNFEREIEFRNGSIYRYLEVPANVYEALLNARSKARYYDENIRHKYRSQHVKSRAE